MIHLNEKKRKKQQKKKENKIQGFVKETNIEVKTNLSERSEDKFKAALIYMDDCLVSFFLIKITN